MFTREAFNLGRTDGEFTGQFLRSRLSGPSDPRLMGLDIDARSERTCIPLLETMYYIVRGFD